MGQISENELLQLKLSALNAKAFDGGRSDLNAKMFQLRAFLGVGEDENLRPVIPRNCGRNENGIQSSVEQSFGT